MVDGEILLVDPPCKLVTTFHTYHNGTIADRPSRVTYEITPSAGGCTLTLTHDDFDGETATYRGVKHSWETILGGLKTLLESEPAVATAWPPDCRPHRQTQRPSARTACGTLAAKDARRLVRHDDAVDIRVRR